MRFGRLRGSQAAGAAVALGPCPAGAGAAPAPGAEHEPWVCPAALLAASAPENSTAWVNLLARQIYRLLLVQFCPSSETAIGRSCSIYALW